MNTNPMINKIKLLNENCKALVIGDLEEPLYEVMQKAFHGVQKYSFNEETKDILNQTFLSEYDLVIFVPNDIKDIDYIPFESIVILKSELSSNIDSFLNKFCFTLIDTISSEEFLQRVYILLASKEMESVVKTKQKLAKKYHVEDSVDLTEFLERNTGSIMFLNEDLNEYITRLNNFELSSELLSDITKNLISLSEIFKENEKLQSVTDVFVQLGQFIQSIELEELQPQQLSSFDYLIDILNDITIYIDELFIYKVFKDVKIFEDSLLNNIEFFEAKLYGLDANEDDDNLEFF